MPETKEQRLERIFSEARKLFDSIYNVANDERVQCMEDRRFYAISGAQWEGDLAEQFANKPMPEVNKVFLAIIRIISEYRANRIAVKFSAKDGVEDPKLAELCAGLLRADEKDSNAEEAFDNAFEEAVSGGMGAFRLRAVYEDDEDPDNDKQRIRFEPIYDADVSVYFDLNAKRQDKADARHCFVITSMSLEAFLDLYPDQDPNSWEHEPNQFDWFAEGDVYVAEYYRVQDKVREELVTFDGPSGDEKVYKRTDLTPEVLNELMSTGYVEGSSRKVLTKKVRKYIMSGGGVLEDCGYIAGKRIPIIPNYGYRVVIDGIERCTGHVRRAKDPQRIKNMMLSKLEELCAQPSVSKPILFPEQVSRHDEMWSRDNMDNYPYMLIDIVKNQDGSVLASGPIGYTKAPELPAALVALSQSSDQDLRDTLGNPEAAERLLSNVAEKTVARVQDKIDVQTAIYVSNFAKTMRAAGEVWLSMAQDLYVEKERKMKTVSAEGALSSVTLMSPTVDPSTKGMSTTGDLSKAKFDVSVDVGPSTSSKRSSIRQVLTDMLAQTQDPETAQILQSMVLMNLETDGTLDVSDYFRKKLVKMGVVKPTEEEAKELQAAAQGAQPTANDQALLGMAEESNAKAMLSRVSTLKVLAEVEKIKAEVAKIAADIEGNKGVQILDALSKISSQGAVLSGGQ
jgi:hypothetical protein